jgi:hypothetical protein
MKEAKLFETVTRKTLSVHVLLCIAANYYTGQSAPLTCFQSQVGSHPLPRFTSCGNTRLFNLLSSIFNYKVTGDLMKASPITSVTVRSISLLLLLFFSGFSFIRINLLFNLQTKYGNNHQLVNV